MNGRRVSFLLVVALCCGIWLAPQKAMAVSIAPGGSLSFLSDESTCGIDEDGVTRCWGANLHGILGDTTGDIPNSNAPVEVSRDFVAVDTGADHACGLTMGGGVRCWGKNASGQLGDGSTVDSAVPRDVSGLANGVQAISTGYEHSCALLQDGSVRCWGESDDGRLGDGSTSDQTTPHQVLALGAPVLAIAAGGQHTCALMSDHGMKCWGWNLFGQVGDGSQDDRPTPVDVSIGNDITAIATGGNHTCALDDSGGIWCWGRNYAGAVGDGTNTNRLLPVAVYGLGPGSGVQSITAGGYHTCAVTADFIPLCWGLNGSGQLGKGDEIDSFVPVPVTEIGSPVISIQAGFRYTCAVDTDARPYCWGRNGSGEVGYGNFDQLDVLSPVQVSGLDSAAVQVSLLDATSCAVTSKGGAMCWGDNWYGQIGDGSQDSNELSIDHWGARDVFGLTNGVRQVVAGGRHACALKQDGSVWCWGDNTYGQVGDGSTDKRITPVQVTGLANVVAIDAGWWHSCALTSAGAMRCWGHNEQGQIGDGSVDDRHSPIAVSGLDSGVTAISLGYEYTCALFVDGDVRCWGDNLYGQLGDGSRTDRHLPTSIDDTDGYVQIAAGGDHSCGRTTAGMAKCWGRNASGQVGDGSGDYHVESPTPVYGLESGVTLVAAGSSHSSAVQAGVLKCWGDNFYYQLGDGDDVDQPVPETITAISGTIAAVELGNDRSCVLLATGNALCFGDNYDGALGNGYSSNQIIPAEIARWIWREDHIFSGGFEL